ncbi:MAG: hypothetical protein WC223_10290 [Bacteroidales bacterium]|jgi:hypothetical protein
MENKMNKTTNRFNKKNYCLLITLIISLSCFSQNVGINATGAQPNASAGLDVDFSDKGLLIPRISLTSTSSFAPLSAHVAGMVVYNTATTGDVVPGFYYDNGSKWVQGFLLGHTTGDMLYWNGSQWLMIPIGSPGQFLRVSSSNIPVWGGSVFSTITTTAASSITGITAASGGNITNDGGSAVLLRGVCWNTATGPTIANTKTTDGSGTGTFISNLTGLTPVATYYVRAYSINSSVITYGNEISFTTLPVLPTLDATTAATSITGTTAISGGNVTSNGGAAITERGVCYGTTANPTTANTKVIDASPGVSAFTSNLTSLTGYTTYYVRAYAINSVGTAYGTQISFTTLRIPPMLVTAAVSGITGASATSGGSMTWNGGGYSNYQAYGVAYSTTSNSSLPTKVATNSTNYPYTTPIAPWTTNITGLIGNTTYYIRSYLDVYPTGTGPWTTIYGNELSFTTAPPTTPVLASTTAITNITSNSASSGGTITSDGGSPITAKGVCWSTSPSPTIVNSHTSDGTGSSNFVSAITGLNGNTIYYVRAYATNSVGTSYGPADVSFTTCGTPIYTIGQNAGGGIVFYVDCTGQHGLIAASADQGTAVWGCSTVLIGTSAAYGTGSANTTAILAGCATRPIAASLARSYNGGGFSDWFLPSTGELQLMMNQHTLLGFGSSVIYTTSSENSVNNVTCMYWNGSTVINTAAVKTYSVTVRAIRAF